MKRFFIALIVAIILMIVLVKKNDDFVFKREEITICISGEVKAETCLKLPLGSKLSDLPDKLDLSEIADLSFFDQNIVLRNNDKIEIPSKGETVKISLNKSDVSELCKLPGIGPVLAQRIIDYRLEYGFFQRLEDIQKVRGIKTGIYEKIKDLICL